MSWLNGCLTRNYENVRRSGEECEWDYVILTHNTVLYNLSKYKVPTLELISETKITWGSKLTWMHSASTKLPGSPNEWLYIYLTTKTIGALNYIADILQTHTCKGFLPKWWMWDLPSHMIFSFFEFFQKYQSAMYTMSNMSTSISVSQTFYPFYPLFHVQGRHHEQAELPERHQVEVLYPAQHSSAGWRHDKFAFHIIN